MYTGFFLAVASERYTILKTYNYSLHVIKIHEKKLKSLKKLQGIKVTLDMAQVNVVACAFHVMCIKMSLQCCQSRTDTDRVKGSRASNVR